jgi:hypothetical protein
MSSPVTPTNKFTDIHICPLFSNDKTGIIFTIDSDPITNYRQYLALNSYTRLQKLAKIIGINKREIKDMSHYELSTYLTQRIDFQIPEDLVAHERGPLRILDKFIDFQQIYIPLSEQEHNTFRYKPNPRIKAVEYNWYMYPFDVDTDKRSMQILCKRIGIMNLGDSKKYTTEELAELLNEKFVLQERAS